MLKKMVSKTQTLSILDNFKGKFRVKDPATCPNCGIFGHGLSNILKKFGLRTMTDGIIRVQFWCIACRKPAKKYATISF